MQVRLTVAFCLLALVGVVASALVTLQLESRRAEVEANRRLTTAANFMMTLLAAERDRNRSDALELSSRLTLQQLLAVRDSAGLSRLLIGLRQTVRDDLLAVYAADGTLIASDAVPEIRLDEPLGLVRGALAGSTGTATLVHDGHLIIAAAAPIVVSNEIVGAVLAGDLLDERYVRRISGSTDLIVALTVENGFTVATEPLSGPLLTSDHWAALRGRGDLWLTTGAAARPLRVIARPLLGNDNRPVGAMVLGLPTANLVPIESVDVPIYLAINGAVLLGLWAVGAVVAWGLTRRPARPIIVAPYEPVVPSLAITNGQDLGHASDLRQLPGLVIDRGRRRVQVGDRDVMLTLTEFDLLWALAEEPGRVMTRDELLTNLRGVDWQAEPGLLDSHVSNLRRKIEPNPSRPRLVLTVRGIGYKLADQPLLEQ